VDEPFDTMGEALSLPPFLEPRRVEIPGAVDQERARLRRAA